jgi:hypothetical protein
VAAPAPARADRRGLLDRLAAGLTSSLAADTRAQGLPLYVPHLRAGWPTCTGARNLPLSLRERGKQVVVFLPLGGGN